MSKISTSAIIDQSFESNPVELQFAERINNRQGTQTKRTWYSKPQKNQSAWLKLVDKLQPISCRITDNAIEAYGEREGVICKILVEMGYNRVNAIIVSDLASRNEEYYQQILLPIFKREEIEPDDDTVYVNFWALGPQGPLSVRRDIDVPKWKDIKENYHPDVAGHIESLLDSKFKPGAGGQLILWSGDTGTGKTYALRALLRSWDSWCSGEYITDPERFFGSDAAYMIRLLLDSGTGMIDGEDERKWRLLILEDTGELLSADAKERAGQGLSRLLNVVDGLIGQGLRILILITTNEDFSNLHPAVARPGRTASKTEFVTLTREQAVKWMEKRNPEKATLVKTGASLAELYAKAGGLDRKDNKRRAGFSMD